MSEAPKPTEPIEVFYAYAHEDELLRDKLEKHLSILKRQGVITGWHDRKISPGREWEGEIDTHLKTARIILLLISPDFLASDYCWGVEVKRAMAQHEAGEARVIPIILRPVDWKGAPCGKLQALPTDAKPVTSWANCDEAFENIAKGIRAAAAELISTRPHVHETIHRQMLPTEQEGERQKRGEQKLIKIQKLKEQCQTEGGMYHAQLDHYGLDDWMAEFHEIYGAVNEGRTIQDIWLHAVEHASELHEDLRIGRYATAFGHIADLFCWLCAFTTKAYHEFGTKNSLHEIVLCKYPRICFYCGGKQCFCTALIGSGIEDPEVKAEFKKTVLERAAIERKNLRDVGNEPKSLNEIAEMLNQIYDHINFRTPLEVIMSHLQEEVGEVATCLNDFKDKAKNIGPGKLQLELELEIADVMTWSLALFQKLDYLLGSGKIYLDSKKRRISQVTERKRRQSLGVTFPGILWEHFQRPDGNTLWCPRCEARPCKLELHHRSS
jgi:NTP pyrophosphatase (non-canonical NTP hydrolase)